MYPLVDVPRPRLTAHPARLDDFLSGALAPRIVVQPIVDLDSRTTYGHEVLARFGERLTQSPAAWFAAAQTRRESDRLQAHVLRAALLLVNRLKDSEFLAVNIGPDVLISPRLRKVLAEHGPLDGIVVELTEHVHVDDLTSLRAACDQLRALGARIALDDVGAGWSGLAQIAALEPDILKIDRSLITYLDLNPAKKPSSNRSCSSPARSIPWSSQKESNEKRK